MDDPEFESQAEEALHMMFQKGFGTLRSASGEYTIQFRFQTLLEAQQTFSMICNTEMTLLRRMEASKPL